MQQPQAAMDEQQQQHEFLMQQQQGGNPYAHQHFMMQQQHMMAGRGMGMMPPQMQQTNGGHPLNSAGAAALGSNGQPIGQGQAQQGGGGGGGAKSTRICRHFARGRCTWGAQCRFSHDVAALAQMGMDPGMGGKPFDMQQGMHANHQLFAAGGMPKQPPQQPQSQLHQSLRQRMDMPPQQAPPAPQQQQPQSQQPSQQAPAAGGSGDTGRSAWLGAQQATLQSQRHAILIAALQAKFQIRTVAAGAGEGGSGQRGQVILTSLTNAPEIVITVYDDAQVTEMLEQLEQDERVREGGLHYLIGESSVFWSMMRLWHVNGSTTSPRWDANLEKAATSGTVECMFYKTTIGCLTQRCNFEHQDGAGNAQVSNQDVSPYLSGNPDAAKADGDAKEEAAPAAAEDKKEEPVAAEEAAPAAAESA